MHCVRTRWDLKDRSSDGQLQPDPALWPSGMDATISYVHNLDLKFGLVCGHVCLSVPSQTHLFGLTPFCFHHLFFPIQYGDRGTLDCAKMPGALGHEVDDANFMAKHKVDWYECPFSCLGLCIALTDRSCALTRSSTRAPQVQRRQLLRPGGQGQRVCRVVRGTAPRLLLAPRHPPS
jgi:hypothetical protein